MNNTQLQIKFQQRLNKLASDDYDNIECWQMIEAFNKAQLMWCRRQLHGTNMHKEGDERSKKRIDDLQILLINQPLINGTDQGDFISYSGTNFPDDYLEYKRVSAEAFTDCCPIKADAARSMTVYLAEEADVDLIMRDTLKRPDFEWGETFCTMRSNTIRIYKRDFDIYKAALTYYRNPRRIEINGCTDPITKYPFVADVECEFKDDVAEIILDEAVAILAGDINDINTYTRENQSVEKNN
tara:strand:+ start:209 stop:931 length:723 start_codon:yes stop_codon:yes gene_type:complete